MFQRKQHGTALPAPAFYKKKTIGVALQNLTKKFGSSAESVIAVNNLSMNFYEDEISVVLGPNGAGKTTLFSMIVGTLAPSSGDVTVAGYSVKKNLLLARKSLGYCPQFDILFPDLSTVEHLWFYTRMKTGAALDDETANTILLGASLLEHAGTLGRYLSGGTKRKLSVILSFIGSSTVVVLDEPTSGVDPSSRRAIWDILEQNKYGRTVLLSTHLMEEAETLGDKISILNFGSLKAEGTLAELQKYAKEYKLSVGTNSKTNSKEIKGAVSKHFPHHYEEAGSLELVFVLPEQEDTSHLISLIKEFQSLKSAGTIASFSVRIAGLEQIFLNVLEDETILNPKSKKKQGWKISKSWFKTLSALTTKRYLYAKRHLPIFLCQVFGPLLLVLLACLAAVSHTKTVKSGPREITPWMFDNEGKNELFIKTSPSSPFIYIEKEITSETGMGIKCVKYKENDKITSCVKAPFTGNFIPTAPSENFSEVCSCETGHFECNDKLEKFSHANSVLLSTGDTLYNAGTRNVTEYLLATDRKSYGKRYGGIETLDSTIRIWYDGRGPGAASAYMNAAHNMVFRHEIGKHQKHNYNFGISVIYNPLPKTGEMMKAEEEKQQEEDETEKISISVLTGPVFLTLAASIATACAMFFYIAEKTSKGKHIQFLANVSPLSYWIHGFLWDYIGYLFICLLILAIFATFNYLLVKKGEAYIVFLLLSLFGWASLGLNYTLSLYFQAPSTAFVIVTAGFLLLALFLIMVDLVLSLIFSKHWPFEQTALVPLFTLLPQFAIMRCLFLLIIFIASGKDNVETLLQWQHTGATMLELFIVGSSLFVFLLLFDLGMLHYCNVFKYLYCNKKSTIAVDAQNIMFPVYKDRSLLSASDLQKAYSCCGHLAVDGVTLNVQHGMCFGLLGANGAGKSTTFKMITGEIYPTKGTIVLNTREDSTDMGYCPQVKSTLNSLTPEEHFWILSKMHGYETIDIDKVINELIETMGLEEYAKKPTCQLSGETNRRVSTAISLLGNPSILLLDGNPSFSPKCQNMYFSCVLM